MNSEVQEHVNNRNNSLETRRPFSLICQNVPQQISANPNKNAIIKNVNVAPKQNPPLRTQNVCYPLSCPAAPVCDGSQRNISIAIQIPAHQKKLAAQLQPSPEPQQRASDLHSLTPKFKFVSILQKKNVPYNFPVSQPQKHTDSNCAIPKFVNVNVSSLQDVSIARQNLILPKKNLPFKLLAQQQIADPKLRKLTDINCAIPNPVNVTFKNVPITSQNLVLSKKSVPYQLPTQQQSNPEPCAIDGDKHFGVSNCSTPRFFSALDKPSPACQKVVHHTQKNPADNVILMARGLSKRLLTNESPEPSIRKDSKTQNITTPLETIKDKEEVREISDQCDESFSEDEFQPKKSKQKSSGNCQSKNHPTEMPTKVPNLRKKPEQIAASVQMIKEKSLSNPSFEKVHDALPSLMPDYVVMQCSEITASSEGHWSATIRANIYDRKSAEDWLASFTQVSKCDYRVKKTKLENSSRLVMKREYRCQFHRKPRDPKPSKRLADGKKPIRREVLNTSCPAIVRITIKQKSMGWSSDDLLQEYPCEIFLRHHHNHRVAAADVLRHRRPSPEIREKFLKMFAAGHSPLSAIVSHKFDLLMEHGEEYIYVAADGSRCPSNFWVYKLFNKESFKHYGPQTGEEMVDALRKFCSDYNAQMREECCKVELLNGRDLITVVCTPMMRRVHRLLRSSGEMMFMDSSGTMDVLNSRVFLLQAPSIAGALPLGILILSSEDQSIIQHGLNLWKSLLPPDAFFGRGPEVGPKIAMTDDCKAERNALKNSFPGIILLLCIFHVLQAFWNYIWDKQHNVRDKDRVEIFFIFKDILYAPDFETFEKRIEEAKRNPKLLANSIAHKHILDFVARAPEWALCHRVELLTRGHDTNNYSEAGMRLLKEYVFERIKCFNSVQLLDFLVTRFPTVIEMRITDVLNHRAMHSFKSRYFIDPSKLEDLRCEKLPSPPDCYKVINCKKKTEYIVIMSHEICSCPIGKNGTPCKHQCAVVRDFKLSSQQFLPRLQAGEEVKLILFEIMHGHRNVANGWFKGLFDHVDTECPHPTLNNITTCTVDEVQASPEEPPSSIPSDQGPEDSSEDSIAHAAADLELMVSDWIISLKNRPDIFLKPCETIVKNHKKMVNCDSALISALMQFGKTIGPSPLSQKKRRQCTIPVQPKSVARRKVSLGGRKAHRGGRPVKDLLQPKPDEHSYGVPLKRKNEDGPPNWATLPKRVPRAPHCLEQQVLRNLKNGNNHSRNMN